MRDPTEKLPETSEDFYMLTDEKMIKAIVEKAEIRDTDTVLEIGGGTGNITSEIIKYAGKVIVIEKNKKYVGILEEKFRSDRLTIVEGNILDMAFPFFNKIISNPPFSIIEPLFLKLIGERRYNFENSVFILPESFLKKMVAPPFSPLFGVVSALFMAFYDVGIFAEVPSEAFDPPHAGCHCVKVEPRTVDSEGTIQFLLQNMFLFDEKKVKNTLMETFWNYGSTLTGTSLTKRNSIALVHEIFGEEYYSFSDKRVKNLSNEDMRKIVSLLINWDSKRH